MADNATVDTYLDANADRISRELTNEGKAVLVALKQYSAAGGASTIADGADVTEGTIADAAVAAGAAGTVNAHLRSISRDVALPIPKPSTATASPTRFTNIGADATLNVKASAGNVFALVCDNANAAVRYLQLHNTATFPADQAVPVYSFRIPATAQLGVGEDIFSTAGVNFSTGIAFAFSTTRDTYTAGTASDQFTVVHFK